MPETAPNVGQAIGLTAEVDDNKGIILSELSRRRQEEDAVAAAARKAATKRQSDIEKNSANIGNWIMTQESGIHPVYHEKLAAMAENIRQRFREGVEGDRDNYSPIYDPEMNRLRFEFKQEADKDRQSTKNIVRDLGIKAADQKGKYDINEGIYSAINTRSYADFVKANGGSDYYAMGMNIPKPEVTSWTKDAGAWAQKLKSMYRKNPDGSKYIDPKDFEEQWNTIKNDPGAEWIHNADAVNKAAGLTDEQSEAQVKQYILNLLPNQPAPDVSTGAGTGTKAKYEFSNPELYERSSKSGADNYYAVTITKKGGGALPIDFYGNEAGQSILARPTGVIKKYENTGKTVMVVAVPDKALTTSTEWKDMDDAQRQQWLEKKYQEDPNKFRQEEVPVAGANQNKVEASYGKPVAEIFKGGAKPATKKESPKTVSAAKIKSLVGAKGYEGYSEKELIDYYKSQGYIVQ